MSAHRLDQVFEGVFDICVNMVEAMVTRDPEMKGAVVLEALRDLKRGTMSDIAKERAKDGSDKSAGRA